MTTRPRASISCALGGRPASMVAIRPPRMPRSATTASDAVATRPPRTTRSYAIVTRASVARTRRSSRWPESSIDDLEFDVPVGALIASPHVDGSAPATAHPAGTGPEHGRSAGAAGHGRAVARTVRSAVHRDHGRGDGALADAVPDRGRAHVQIGRASCRESVYVRSGEG